MRVLLFFLSVVLFGLVCKGKQTVCDKQLNFLQIGDKCYNSNCDVTASPGTCCAVGLQCYNNTCLRNNLGRACAFDTDCFYYGEYTSPGSFAGYTSVRNHSLVSPTNGAAFIQKCVKGKCQQRQQLNDGCSSNEDCDTQLSCDKGVCTGTGDVNQACPCKVGLTCSNNVCVRPLSKGQSCSTGIPCRQDSFCNASLICEPYGSRPAGATCTTDDNLECDFKHVCYNKVCVKFDEGSIKGCGSHNECPGNFSCACDKFIGRNLCSPTTNLVGPSDCRAEFMGLRECLLDNNCSLDSEGSMKNTCASKHCKSKYRSLNNCFCANDRVLMGDASACVLHHSTWVIVVIVVIVALILILVFVGVLFFLKKRQGGGYETL